MQVPSPCTFEPNSDSICAALAALPQSAGIYALSSGDHPPHLSWSVNLKRRLTRLLVPSYTAAPQHFSKYTGKISAVSYWPVGSRLESSLLLYALTSRHYPADYLRRLHLRMPWFIAMTSDDSFPRLEAANRLPRKFAAQFGPFLNRDTAQQYEEQVLSLHQLRRCTESLVPHPDHPGCIYGEMNQCLRPCQCAVTVEEYASEAARVREFLLTAGKSALAPLAAARASAAEQLDFEQAAMIHKRMEKVQTAQSSRDKVVRLLDNLNGVALTRSSQPGAVCLWPMLAGYWRPSVTLLIQTPQPDAKPLDATIREALTRATENTEVEGGNRLEHQAIFARWYYSSWRDGSWFAFDRLPDLNYRRLVREMSNLVKPAGPA